LDLIDWESHFQQKNDELFFTANEGFLSNHVYFRRVLKQLSNDQKSDFQADLKKLFLNDLNDDLKFVDLYLMVLWIF